MSRRLRPKLRIRDASLFHSLIDHPVGTSFRFADTLPVQVRSLASLRQTGEIPRQIGLLKVDTEGADIDVIKGLGEPDIPVVMTEYWDSDHAFGKGSARTFGLHGGAHAFNGIRMACGDLPRR